MSITAFRSRILHFVDDPTQAGEDAYQYLEDGILVIEDGRVHSLGPTSTMLEQLRASTPIEHLEHHLLIPGFIDAHTHYPQTQMIGAYGEQLLSWLEGYTFPAETHFYNPQHARKSAEVFVNELLRNGTTTAMVFATVHPESVHAFFAECQSRNLRMIAGKVCMDRHAPEKLLDTPALAYQQSKSLIERWHGAGRLQYAVTPRFAPSSTAEQLQRLGQLLHEHPGVYMQTHLAENAQEVSWVSQLYPGTRSYLDVYDRAGLLGRRSVLAHGIHLDDADCQRLGCTRASIAHCPTSNLFLGSGLFEMDKLERHGVTIALGTDIGAGTSFSMLSTMSEAYKIQQLRGIPLDPFQALYLATLGGARALDLEGTIGNFALGNEADYIALDLQATPLLRYRLPFCRSLKDLLFALSILGDDRTVARTYSMGRCVHSRE